MFWLYSHPRMGSRERTSMGGCLKLVGLAIVIAVGTFGAVIMTLKLVQGWIG